jgi:hypothetical protein
VHRRRERLISKLSPGRRQEHRSQIELQTGKHGLGLGVSETDVELQHLGTVLCDHDPDVEKTAVVDLFAIQTFENRFHDKSLNLF